jgi:serine/threonine protein kinase
VIAGLEILNLHAQGGMAEVYRARGKGADGTEYLYALKRILPEYTRDAEIKKMFIEESRVAACLVHPNVVRVYDLATSEADELYIVMEFLEGKDLSEAIEEATKKRKTLPIWFALQIAKEVLRALLDRLAPPRKERPVTVDLPPLTNPTDAPRIAAALLEHAASGELTPTEAQSLAALLEAFRKQTELASFEERLAALEASHAKR